MLPAQLSSGPSPSSQLLYWAVLWLRMHVLGQAFGTQQCPASQPRPSQNRLTWKFKNFMFLAAAQASGPRLVSIFSHSWGSSNLAIPQSAAAVVVWRDRGVAEFIVVCSSARDKQHAEGQQSRLQMQLRGFVRCTSAGHCCDGHHAKSPTSSLQQFVLGLLGCSRLHSSCRLQRNDRHCMHQVQKAILTGGAGVLQLKHVSGRGCKYAYVSPTSLLQQLVVNVGVAYKRAARSATLV